MDPEQSLAVKLAHSRRVVMPDGPEDCRGIIADGILAKQAGASASVTVADCMPIWILDRSTGRFGVLHSGWAGTGILMDALDLLAGIPGHRPSAVSIILGPCIGPCCYRVPPERAIAFMDAFGAEAAVYKDGSWRLDMRAANAGIVRARGLPAPLIADECSACDARFGSSRREGRAAFTRMLAIVGAIAAEGAGA